MWGACRVTTNEIPANENVGSRRERERTETSLMTHIYSSAWRPSISVPMFCCFFIKATCSHPLVFKQHATFYELFHAFHEFSTCRKSLNQVTVVVIVTWPTVAIWLGLGKRWRLVSHRVKVPHLLDPFTIPASSMWGLFILPDVFFSSNSCVKNDSVRWGETAREKKKHTVITHKMTRETWACYSDAI